VEQELWEVEEEIVSERDCFSDSKVLFIVSNCLSDMLNSRHRHLKHYLHIVDLYWQLKSLLKKVLLERNDTMEEFLCMLDEL